MFFMQSCIVSPEKKGDDMSNRKYIGWGAPREPFQPHPHGTLEQVQCTVCNQMVRLVISDVEGNRTKRKIADHYRPPRHGEVRQELCHGSSAPVAQ